MQGIEAQIWVMGIKIFLLVWVVFVPVAITSRLERIAKALEQRNK